ncbi:uncharacterized protein AMSG_09294 [Thecamonas trahens ATCC 50062]|uniref:Uncharacterized protein n=1 Tax=Thecamonas trahens ATCC 50062 TaxID=461836 RepID=A0A0L0DP60_THETB|nr:hypothetical protein AMSG_09294 [Thecamonas trahens ATCC 50062]KNC53208.1 hypothetical protein AMSG_09294 [Thecamonas trahens ATCC 50062]|eukprot:XP_013754677.1 hypothetical protein AMSG_09294 [Thecamonas trahens ATCC 50062]
MARTSSLSRKSRKSVSKSRKSASKSRKSASKSSKSRKSASKSRKSVSKSRKSASKSRKSASKSRKKRRTRSSSSSASSASSASPASSTSASSSGGWGRKIGAGASSAKTKAGKVVAVAKSGGRKTGKVGKKGTGHLVNVVEKAGEGVLDDVRDVKKMYASKEFRAFIRNPTPEAIMANPEYVIVTAKLLLAINHPEGAILAAVVEHLVEASEEELLEASRKDCNPRRRRLQLWVLIER